MTAEHTVTVTVALDPAPSCEVIDALAAAVLAELPGGAFATVTDRTRVTITLDTGDPDILLAAATAEHVVERLLVRFNLHRGHRVVAVEAMTVAEQEARLAEPAQLSSASRSGQ